MRTEISQDNPAPEAAHPRAAYEPPMLVRVNVVSTEFDIGEFDDGLAGTVAS